MGGGRWSVDTYEEDAKARRADYEAGRRATASAFNYNDSGAKRTHAELDPKGVTRECRNSAEHPASLPIAILFDVTGSMQFVPRLMQERLPELFGLLDRNGVVDPQILFGAIGDATTDSGPLQVGQFESDNRMDDQLGKVWLEGNGGGQQPPRESYEMALYWLARHTELDATADGRQGYAFLIGDEMPYAEVMPRARYGARAGVSEIIGDTLDEPISVEAIIAEVSAKYHLYFLNPMTGTSHAGDPEILARWRGLLGEGLIEVPDMTGICELISDKIRLGEHLAADALKAKPVKAAKPAPTATAATP
jgi:hypothetical protein